MTHRRWLKWVIEADANKVELPWTRGKGRTIRKERAKARARAA